MKLRYIKDFLPITFLLMEEPVVSLHIHQAKNLVRIELQNLYLFLTTKLTVQWYIWPHLQSPKIPEIYVISETNIANWKKYEQKLMIHRLFIQYITHSNLTEGQY